MQQGQERGPARRADAVRNRDRLLDSSLAVLGQNPKASIADIAQEAGVARATAYRHFADTDALRAALLDEALAVGRVVLRDGLPAMLDGAGSPVIVDEIDRILRATVPLRHRSSAVFALEEVDVKIAETFGPIAVALLRRAQAAGQIRRTVDPEAAAEALLTLVLRAIRDVQGGGRELDRALAPVSLLLDGLRT